MVAFIVYKELLSSAMELHQGKLNSHVVSGTVGKTGVTFNATFNITLQHRTVGAGGLPWGLGGLGGGLRLLRCAQGRDLHEEGQQGLLHQVRWSKLWWGWQWGIVMVQIWSVVMVNSGVNPHPGANLGSVHPCSGANWAPVQIWIWCIPVLVQIWMQCKSRLGASPS